MVSRVRRNWQAALTLRLRRYREAADAAHAQYLAVLNNETAREERIDDDKYDRETQRAHVFDGRDADRMTRRAEAAEARRERAAERKEQEDLAASRAGAAARLAAKAAREQDSAAREKSELAADRHQGTFTLRDKATADAAAEREATKEESAWENHVER